MTVLAPASGTIRCDILSVVPGGTTITYPGSGTHNCAVSSDGGYLLTTDEINATEKTLTLVADDEFRMNAIWDVVQTRLVRRNVPVKNFEVGKSEASGGGAVKRVIKIQEGIPIEAAKEIVKFLKDKKIKKVQGSIQGDQVRVTSPSKDDLQEAMRAGVREFITAPFEQSVLIQSLVHLKILLEKHPVRYAATDQIFSFIPAKAGAGTSTIAVNVAAAMTRIPNTRVLLGDFDLSSGMTRFMLKKANISSSTSSIFSFSSFSSSSVPSNSVKANLAINSRNST